MRNELTILEQIDHYLGGKLSSTDHAIFEQKIAVDSELKQLVDQQKELIRAVKRQALRTQINTVAIGASGAGGLSNAFLGITTLVAVGVITAAVIYFNRDVAIEANPEVVKNETIVTKLDTDTIISFHHEEEVLVAEVLPETIFSSQKDYEEELLVPAQVNVVMDYSTKEEKKPVLFESQTSGVTLTEQEQERSELVVPEIDRTEGVNLTRRATYPGGNIALKNFIDDNLHYPKSAKDKGIEGVVRCDFHVTKDGLISEISAECIHMNEKGGISFNEVRELMNHKIMNSFINNATHILRTMPVWESAKNAQGSPVISVQRMYFNYDMEKGCLVYQFED